MNAADTLAAIVAHGLSVRQIPREVVHLYEMQHFREGDTVQESEIREAMPARFDWLKNRQGNPANWRFDDENRRAFRRYARRVTVPANAGHWMCKQVADTSSSVEWIKKTDNLAPTIPESVALFLSKQSAPQPSST